MQNAMVQGVKGFLSCVGYGDLDIEVSFNAFVLVELIGVSLLLGDVYLIDKMHMLRMMIFRLVVDVDIDDYRIYRRGADLSRLHCLR